VGFSKGLRVLSSLVPLSFSKVCTLSVGTEEIFASIDNLIQLRPSITVGRTCCAVQSFLCWFATTKFNILLILVCCHIKRKKIISVVLLKKLK